MTTTVIPLIIQSNKQLFVGQHKETNPSNFTECTNSLQLSVFLCRLSLFHQTMAWISQKVWFIQIYICMFYHNTSRCELSLIGCSTVWPTTTHHVRDSTGMLTFLSEMLEFRAPPTRGARVTCLVHLCPKPVWSVQWHSWICSAGAGIDSWVSLHNITTTADLNWIFTWKSSPPTLCWFERLIRDYFAKLANRAIFGARLVPAAIGAELDTDGVPSPIAL